MPDAEQTDETLRDLLAAAVGKDRPMTYDAFLERAVDRDSGYRPSRGIIQRIIQNQSAKINPPLLAAIAAGLDQPLEIVQAAASRQYLGLDWDPIADLHGPETHVVLVAGADLTDAEKAQLREMLSRHLAEIRAMRPDAGDAPGTPGEHEA